MKRIIYFLGCFISLTAIDAAAQFFPVDPVYIPGVDYSDFQVYYDYTDNPPIKKFYVRNNIASFARMDYKAKHGEFMKTPGESQNAVVDENGVMISNEIFRNNKLKEKILTLYNDTLLETISRDADGDIISRKVVLTKNKNVVSSANYGKGGENMHTLIKNSYNSNDKMTERSSFYGRKCKLSYRMVYVYNDNGSMKEYMWYNRKGKLRQRTSYECGLQGQALVNQKDTVKICKKTYYDTDSNRIETVIRYEKDEMVRYVNMYNRKNQKMLSLSYGPEGPAKDSAIYYYDENGSRYMINHYTLNKKTGKMYVNSTTNSTFSAAGKIQSSKVVYYKAKSEKPLSRQEYLYENDKIIDISYFHNETLFSRRAYKYDAKGIVCETAIYSRNNVPHQKTCVNYEYRE